MAIRGSDLSPALRAALEEAVNAAPASVDGLAIERVALDLIIPGNNDRVDFKHVSGLADSIQAAGLLQPINLNRVHDDLFQVVAGESRYRAFKLLHQQYPHDARWQAIPAIVRELSADEASVFMLAENGARKDLNPLEEARAYQSRIEAGWDIERCAKVYGRRPNYVKNRLDLLKLNADIQQLIATGNLEPQYGQIIAAAGLDANFQSLAMRAFNNNGSPTPAWFRSVVGDLAGQQAQVPLFDMFQLPMCVAQIVAAPDQPPTPATCIPPARGKHPLNILSSQARYWRDAAAAWDKLGKWKQRDQCTAAAQAIETAIKLIETVGSPQVESLREDPRGNGPAGRGDRFKVAA